MIKGLYTTLSYVLDYDVYLKIELVVQRNVRAVFTKTHFVYQIARTYNSTFIITYT